MLQVFPSGNLKKFPTRHFLLVFSEYTWHNRVMQFNMPEIKETESFAIFFRSEFRVLRTDPEYADMDNPRGEILGEVWFAVAEDVDGYRWVWGGSESEAAARQNYEFFAPPVSEWYYAEPAYGSRAYLLEGSEEYWAQREALEDRVCY